MAKGFCSWKLVWFFRLTLPDKRCGIYMYISCFFSGLTVLLFEAFTAVMRTAARCTLGRQKMECITITQVSDIWSGIFKRQPSVALDKLYNHRVVLIHNCSCASRWWERCLRLYGSCLRTEELCPPFSQFWQTKEPPRSGGMQRSTHGTAAQLSARVWTALIRMWALLVIQIQRVLERTLLFPRRSFNFLEQSCS